MLEQTALVFCGDYRDLHTGIPNDPGLDAARRRHHETQQGLDSNMSRGFRRIASSLRVHGFLRPAARGTVA